MNCPILQHAIASFSEKYVLQRQFYQQLATATLQISYTAIKLWRWQLYHQLHKPSSVKQFAVSTGADTNKPFSWYSFPKQSGCKGLSQLEGRTAGLQRNGWRERDRIGIHGRRWEREIKQKRETKTKGGERGEASLNWESITEAWVQRPLSVSRKHTEMCSSAGAL